MIKFVAVSVAILMSFGIVVTDVAARGFRGGHGFSMHRSSHMFYKPTKNQLNHKTMRQRWQGPLTGFLLGSLFASLFMGHGFASAIFSWTCLAMLAMAAIKLFKRLSVANRATSE
ncbi:MAG: hypothetical protein ACOVQX_04620 [Legionella sp.]